MMASHAGSPAKMAEFHAIEAPESNPEIPVVIEPTVPTQYKVRGKIPDISKWNGKSLNFKAMSTEADIIFARGLCRITKDSLVGPYVDAMDANGIPYGLYNFTYAETMAEIIRDAKLFRSIVKAHRRAFSTCSTQRSDL